MNDRLRSGALALNPRRTGMRNVMTALVAVLLGALVVAWAADNFTTGALETWLKALDLDPAVVILLRGAAALLAFVPSSPIVIAAGASHGLLWGSIYVLIGAELGAIFAFLIGRSLGRRFVERQVGLETLMQYRYARWLLEGDAAQGRLALAVLYCRLIPGLNLDGLSYVAGLTQLKLWRFCLATFAGLLPYTVLLIAIGHQIQELELVYAAGLVLILLAAGATTRLWASQMPVEPKVPDSTKISSS